MAWTCRVTVVELLSDLEIQDFNIVIENAANRRFIFKNFDFTERSEILSKSNLLSNNDEWIEPWS